MIDRLAAPLEMEDIECRVGTCTDKGFSLLLYKTARTDTKRLNNVCGTKWKNRFYLDQNMYQCCEILIYDTDIKEWVGRSDVGVESATEKEKGSYSDAFKRAGFKWGIGAELYNSPFIWIQGNVKPSGRKNKWGKDIYMPTINANSINITNYKVVDAKVVVLCLASNGNTIYNYATPYKTPSKQNNNDLNISKKALMQICKQSGVDTKEFLDFLGVMTDQEKAKQIPKLLSNKAQLLEQIENFIAFTLNQQGGQ